MTETEETNELSVSAKLQECVKIIEENPLGCDMLLSLLINASKSYKVSSLLRPFPAIYKNDTYDEENIILLRKICDKLPAIKDILANNNALSEEEIQFLYWLFVSRTYPILVPCQLIDLPSSIKTQITTKPKQIFQIKYHPNIAKIWKKRCEILDTFFAFHGSPANNFYSILHTGLKLPSYSDNKELLCGNGIYLTSDLSVAFNFSQFKNNWEKSSFSSSISIVAVCEVINDPNKVKYNDSAGSSSAQGWNIPQKYIVAFDSQVVNVSYLLVYENNSKNVRINQLSFLRRNISWFLLAFYIILLIYINCYKNSYFKKMFNVIFK